MKKFIASLLISLSLTAPLAAAEIISFDLGGSVGEYIQKYTAARLSEQKYRIEGLCVSACTMITGNIPEDRVCATEYGILAFHSAWSMTPFGPIHSPEGTRILGQMLPKNVKEMLRARGFDPDKGEEHPDLIYIRAQDIYKACN